MLSRWVREQAQECVISGVVPGGCGKVPGGSFGGWFPGVVSGAGTGMAAGRRTGMCGRDGLGLPGAARGREYTDFSGGRYALIILFVADY